jgi:hypothetical protein
MSKLWQKEQTGVWTISSNVPLGITSQYHLLLAEFSRIVYSGIRPKARGLTIDWTTLDLDTFLWMDVTAAVREHRRYKRCVRCNSWFAVQRTDALYCSATCRNLRATPADVLDYYNG